MESMNMGGQSSSESKPAVRIIFRGLILFRIENENEENGRIVAQLIDHDAAESMGGMSMRGSDVSAVHRHEAEVQILSGAKGQSLVPVRLARGVDIEIVPQGGRPVSAAASYRNYVPKLSTIIDEMPDSSPRPEKAETRDNRFIRNRIVVHRGTIRVTELVSWDTGGYPLDGSQGQGNEPRLPVDVRFMFSRHAPGRVASECIIDVDNATGVELITSDETLNGVWDPAPKGQRRNQHVAPDTVEILITNLPPQREKPIPWSVHYQWLFRAAGYQPTSVDGAQLGAFEQAAVAYANGAFDVDGEDLSLLDADSALPFPYLEMDVASNRMRRDSSAAGSVVNDPWNRPLCPHGDE